MFNPFKKTALTRMIFFAAADILSITLSVWLAFLMRFDGQIPAQYIPFAVIMACLAVVFLLPIFYFLNLYSFSWSYVSASEAISLFKGTTIGFAFLSIAIFISNYFPRFENFPRAVIFISYFLVFIFCGGVRFAKRVYLRKAGIKAGFGKKDRTLIVGAGDAGEQILRSIQSSGRTPYHPVGFADDNPIKKGVLIHGLKVLGKISEIPNIAAQKQISQAIVALPSAGAGAIKNAVELCKKASIKKIKIAPPLSEIIRGEVSLKNLKDVGIEDLLGRDQVVLDTKQIEAFVKDKIILITGAAGSIGSELCRQIARFKPSLLVLLDQDETGIFNISNELKNNFLDVKTVPVIGDITDGNKIKEVFQKYHPKTVFHAAAYKHVPLMEDNISEALKNNVKGTQTVARASLDYGTEKFIFISTDKAVNPTSVMGATKRMGEMFCQALNSNKKTKYISVRFGNVLNSRGSVIPIFKEQIKRGGPVTVTHPEMKRYFMLTSEACLLVMQAGAMGEGGEVFVLDMGEPVKIVDLAKEMIRLSGFQPDKDIAIVFTGIRPGEKLLEEMLTAEEGVDATQNKKIWKAKLGASGDYNTVADIISSLNKQLSKEEIMKVVSNSRL